MKTLQNSSNIFSKKDIDNFYKKFCPYDPQDIQTAIVFFMEAGKSIDDLINHEAKAEDDDICKLAWEAVLQEARNKIDEVANYDFVNDFDGDGNIHTHGDYCKTLYFCSDFATEELEEKLQELPENKKNELKNNKVVTKFLYELDISF